MRRTGWTVAVGLSWLLLDTHSARAVEPAVIEKAIERGVQALRKQQTGSGTWPHSFIGATALAGLTLLECDVPSDDKGIQLAAKAVREACPDLTHTYSISLAILFLDRLGEPADLPLIDALAVRLLANQNAGGGWGYTCLVIDGEAEAKLLRAYVKDRPKATRVQGRRTEADMSTEVQAQIKRLRRGDFNTNTVDKKFPVDLSNSQFASLALWRARKHGIPIDAGLNRLAAFYRELQNKDGGWPYQRMSAEGSTGSMTCSGVLGLAVAYGCAVENAKERGARLDVKIGSDQSLSLGLAALGTTIDHPASKRGLLAPRAGGRAYYFLWSVERVAMVLGLEKIGGKDWYTWGAEILLVSQQADGSWVGDYGAGGIDTCFALLFLRRSNLANDLTGSLAPHLKGTVVLKSGALGNDKLTSKLKPGVETSSRTDSDKKGREDSPGARLARKLLDAPAARQERVLEELREGKGVEFTEALAVAIPKLSGADKRKAREALIDRLTRMKAPTLSRYLKDEDVEIRRAAAWACACKESKIHVPELIDMLNDPAATVAFMAHESLKELTGQKLPFDPNGSRADKAKAIAAWKAWWAKQRLE